MDQWRPRLQVYTNMRMLLDKMVLKDFLHIFLLYKRVVREPALRAKFLLHMGCKVLVDIFIKKV